MAIKNNHKNTNKLPQNPTEKYKDTLPAFFFAAKNKSEEARLSLLKKQKKIYKIGPRLYTSLPKSEVAAAVRSQWMQIVSQLYPKALLSHRSALEYKPSPEYNLVLTGTTNRVISYPGLKLCFLRGPSVLTDDTSFLGFHASSVPRALLENLSANKNTTWRTLSVVELETKLEAILKAKGEAEINLIRDRARDIAKNLKWQSEYEKLDQIIGALLGTRPLQILKSPAGKARAQGRPYDSSRVSRFDLLFAELRATPLLENKDNFKALDHFTNKAFFEAYFSNYIEGTTFEIEEAEEIIFNKKIPKQRPKDAHDVLGTFSIVADPNNIKKTPKKFSDLQILLKQRHQILMANRAEAMPGQYKNRPNRAGDSHFVHPNEIEGTLEKGFERYLDLPLGLSRSIFMMFLIAEIHPFTDGNGRIARIMMNSELSSVGLSTIIIPNVYREDYILALRALTRRDRAEPLIRMLGHAHQFSHQMFSPYQNILEIIKNKNWFRDPNDATLID